LKIAITFICACLLSLQLQAQSTQLIDSLRRNIDNNPNADSNKVKSIYQYLKASVYNTANVQPDIDQMLSISRKINFPYGIRKGLSMFVKYYGDRGDFQHSFVYADSLIMFLKNDTSSSARREMGILYSDLANNYNRLGDYQKAIEHYILAVSLFEKINQRTFMALLYINISDVYTRTADSIKSSEYTQRALSLAEQLADEDLKSQALMSHAIDLVNRKQFTNAKQVLDQVEPILMKLENPSYLQSYFYTKGSLAQMQGDCKRAVPYFRKSLHLAQTIDDIHRITGVMKQMFECFTILNNLAEAKSYLDSTLLLAEKAGLKMRRKEVYDGMALWYEKKGDYRNADTYLKKSIVLNDSLISEENNKQIASLEMRYQVAGKNAEIDRLKTEKELQQLSIRQKNILNYVLIGSAIILLVIFFLSYRTYKQKQKLQQQRIGELEKEKQLSATEAVLKGEEQERTRLAKDLHDGLGGMLSGIKYGLQTMKGNLIMTPENTRAFERSMDMLDSSIKEMRRVAHNMMPEALVKFGLDTALRDYCNDINQSGVLQVTYQSFGLENITLDQTLAITTYRIIQELINNTLKHAGAKTAIVQVTFTDQQLSITVEDDGKGFDANILRHSKGIGWANINHRVEFLKGKLDIISQPDKGTSVQIEFSV
jgi:two-component system NarL family sensor kinase